MKRFLLLPILAGLAAAALAMVAHRYLMPGSAADDAEVALMAITAGAVALAVASYASFLRFGLAVMRRTEGLGAFESDMRRRLARLEAGQGVEPRGAMQDDVRTDDLADKGADRTAHAGTAAATALSPSPALSPALNDGGLDKVIRFDARARGAHLPQARLIGARLAQALEKNTIEAWFQPIVSLPGRKTRFFEAVAYLTDPGDGNAANGNEAGRAIEPAYSSAPEIDRRMLLQSLKLLRELDRSGKHAGVIWRLHATALGDAHAFAGIERILDANGALAGRLIARIDHRDYTSLDSAQTDRLHRLREMGFTLAIANCPDAAKAREAVRSALFSLVIIDVARIVAGSDETRSIHRIVAGEQGHPEVEIVASGVDDEQQAMALIDQDVLLAQGDFFSEPRPMRRSAG